MAIEKKLSNSLEEKRRFAREQLEEQKVEALDETKKYSSASKKVYAQMFLQVLIALPIGVVLFFLKHKVLDSVSFLEDFLSATSIIGFLCTLIFIFLAFLLRYMVVQHEEKNISLQKLKGKTNGVVTSMRTEKSGAVSNQGSWTYTPVFTVEYEVEGKSLQADWWMDYSTNMEGVINSEKNEYLGTVVPVYYQIGKPSNTIVGELKKNPTSRKIFLASVYLGFSSLSFMILEIILINKSN